MPTFDISKNMNVGTNFLLYVFIYHIKSHSLEIHIIPAVTYCGNVAWKRIIITLKGRMFYAWLSLANKKRGFLLVTYNKGLFRPSAYQADSLSEISEILV